jgi:hypothetical protein
MKDPAARGAAQVSLAAYAIIAPCLLAGEALGAGHDFRICQGQFALCAASTCQETGRSITVKVTTGGTASFPEVDCTCPIFSGPAIADVNGGNMQGSCAPPTGQVWSLFQPRRHIPQAINNWSRIPSKSLAPPLICSASLQLGNQLANCWSFACDPAGKINGVPVATCHCAKGDSLEGKSVSANTAFATVAGQGNENFCSKHPVSGPLPSAETPSNDVFLLLSVIDLLVGQEEEERRQR